MIPEVCQAICNALDDCVAFPKGNDFLEKAKDFNDLYDFPNEIGIIDRKHVAIRAPPKSGAWFRNFKQNYSINLMAACDARGRIIWASVGDFGEYFDSTIYFHPIIQ